MAINIINPNYYLINAAKVAGVTGSSGTGASPANSSGSVPSFSAAFEDAVSNLQSSAAAAASQAAGTGQTSDASQTTAGSGTTVDLDAIFQKASETYGVPVQLLKAVAKAESNFDPNAGSSAGARGIMQLMPSTASALGVTDVLDPEQNIMGGAKYLSQQLARYDGNTVLALAAYNAGPGNVAKYDGVPPFKETQNYISKVMAYAGEPITAGSLTTASSQSPATTDEITSTEPNSFLKNLETELLNADPSTVDKKDYELLLNLYRYQMQLSVLTEDDTDSDSNNSSLAGNLSTLI